MQEKNIGQVIAEARKLAGYSQRQLAKTANISNAELSKIESGKREIPNPKTLRKISKYINVNYNDMMHMIGLGMEVSPLNPFIKNYYSKMNKEELEEAEINILGSINNLKNLVVFCTKKLNEKKYIDETDLLLNTIEDTEYQISVSSETINLIQTLRLNKNN